MAALRPSGPAEHVQVVLAMVSLHCVSFSSCSISLLYAIQEGCYLRAYMKGAALGTIQHSTKFVSIQVQRVRPSCPLLLMLIHHEAPAHTANAIDRTSR